ncbi:11228_t:CDS:2 [Acaulospora morrowiae]|uniref:11228_t:CDS:1 n=1 Tax=Acaulospora morrowiae TaxID=94023 RepID=A0A9N9NAC7_9GLOM|nr:11228_t:CDS:2 [Acaulospora morrowiae]
MHLPIVSSCVDESEDFIPSTPILVTESIDDSDINDEDSSSEDGEKEHQHDEDDDGIEKKSPQKILSPPNQPTKLHQDLHKDFDEPAVLADHHDWSHNSNGITYQRNKTWLAYTPTPYAYTYLP